MGLGTPTASAVTAGASASSALACYNESSGLRWCHDIISGRQHRIRMYLGGTLRGTLLLTRNSASNHSLSVCDANAGDNLVTAAHLDLNGTADRTHSASNGCPPPFGVGWPINRWRGSLGGEGRTYYTDYVPGPSSW